MNSTAPQIGFDRFLQFDWVAAALKVRAGLTSLEELNELLDAAGLGKEAKAKTRTKLNGLWLEPRPDLAAFADRGIGVLKESPDTPIAALCWGMAIVTYPFFGKVAEVTGRLTSIQGDCSSLEIHRRISEVFGDREVTKRATQAVLQTQANWGAIERIDKGKRLVRQSPWVVMSDDLITWLIEAALRQIGNIVSVSTLQSMAVLYPFTLDRPLAFVVSNSPYLELREGSSDQFLSLRV